jgi:hypothetical protein
MKAKTLMNIKDYHSYWIFLFMEIVTRQPHQSRFTNQTPKNVNKIDVYRVNRMKIK